MLKPKTETKTFVGTKDLNTSLVLSYTEVFNASGDETII